MGRVTGVRVERGTRGAFQGVQGPGGRPRNRPGEPTARVVHELVTDEGQTVSVRPPRVFRGGQMEKSCLLRLTCRAGPRPRRP